MTTVAVRLVVDDANTNDHIISYLREIATLTETLEDDEHCEPITLEAEWQNGDEIHYWEP